MQRSSKAKYTLEELVDGITPENIHPETDWGPPVGNEILELDDFDDEWRAL